MIVAFYKVTNSKNIRPANLEDLDSHDALEELRGLPKDECRMYDMSIWNGGPVPNLSDFATDFNDGVIESWWCILLPGVRFYIDEETEEL